ncbi:MAG: hypothetical protein C4296_11125 [Gemmataceae bacterium]
MRIQFVCTGCPRTLAVAARKAGTVVTCPRCSAQVRVPAVEAGREQHRSAEAGSNSVQVQLQTLQRYEKLVAEYPQVPEYRIEMARSCLGLTGTLAMLGNLLEAWKWHGKAIGILT